MSVAAIYDIHGNLPALEAVLGNIQEAAPDVILVGGDSASGPFPSETLERLMTLGSHVHVIRGNADRELSTLGVWVCPTRRNRERTGRCLAPRSA